MARRFEWDPDKDSANRRKHGITFETASFVFDDPFAILEQDRIESGEYRWQTTGMANAVTLLVVAHTLWDEEEDVSCTHHLVSARRALGTESL